MAPLKNLKHEMFVQHVLRGAREGWNASEAYRRVYGTEGHVPESNASRLLSPAPNGFTKSSMTVSACWCSATESASG
jgi:hypothetical protein